MIYSKIDDICEKKIDIVNVKDDYLIDYIDISSIDNKKKIITSFNTIKLEEAPSRAKQILKRGDILVSTVRPNLNAVAVCDIESNNVIVGSTGYCVLRCKKDVDSRYVFHYCKSEQFISGLEHVATGASYPAVKNSDVKNSLIPMFKLEKQKKISRLLDQAQGIINKRKEQIELLDELIKSRFIEMFGNPFTDDKNFGMDKLGSVTLVNPKKAEVKELDDDLNVSFVPMDRVGEKGEFKPEVSKPIKDVYSGFTYFKDYDVLFAKITPCMENGKGAVAKNLTNGIGFGSTEFHVIRPVREKSNPYWIYHLTTLIDFRRLAERKMTGSAGQKRVPTDFINNIEVVIPPIELQNQFEYFVKQVDKLKFEMENSLKELEDNFNSLMQKAFKGELIN